VNKTNLKRYAPQARKDFIAAVTSRANLLGLSERAGKPHAEACEVKGDVALIGGRPWPADVQGRREALLKRMQREGFSHTLEAVAYTWFNRLAALRYMELHDYLGHGRRVLSNHQGGLPEVLTHALALAESGELPGLLAAKVRDLKLANHDGELYRSALIAQCNALHQAMPFLFEAIDDETELLLPDNLLLSDSIVAKLVAEIPEEDWTEVEAIGWLYQFYISEKKDEVIGKVVKSEDIPAATQLFTPNWIVQYLVQNSVGRLWLMANQGSTLASQWPYYVQPAEQTPEVQAQLDALIQTRIREDGEALNPETITVLDPACGSGHILVVAYDVLKAIYLERGYQPRAIPRLILEKNLYGLDIDDRAAQLAAFALLMKARADDRRLFNDPPKLNVLSLHDSKGVEAEELATHLAPFGLQRAPLKALLDIFEHAKTFGSLIQIPEGLNGQLAAITACLQRALREGDLYAQQAAKDVLPLIEQALLLGMQFDAVVANPPYMGGNGMNALVKQFAIDSFPDAKSDLFACFIECSYKLAKASGFNALVTMQNWMFLSSFERMRHRILYEKTITSMTHIGYNSFPAMNSKVARATAFSFVNRRVEGLVGTFVDLDSAPQAADKQDAFLARVPSTYYFASADVFRKIPGAPIAYWATEQIVRSFSNPPLGSLFTTREGMATADNERFLRFWSEVSQEGIRFGCASEEESESSGGTWFPYNKGGEFRKWYGNNELVVEYSKAGYGIKNNFDPTTGRLRSHNYNGEFGFREGLTWSAITSGPFSVRYSPTGFLFDSKGAKGFSTHLHQILAMLNSCVACEYLSFLSPTLDFKVGDVIRIPLISEGLSDQVAFRCNSAVRISKRDWDSFERSWHFESHPVLPRSSEPASTLEATYTAWVSRNRGDIAEMRRLEEENNRHFINAYGLADQLAPDVPIEQITLTVNPAYRYGPKLGDSNQWMQFRRDTAEELISYSIGCMMGRYSLDEPGLIYANAGNVGFDPSRYEKKFPADADGIVPLTEERWFEKDAARRLREFLRAGWGDDTLEENMVWLAESLGIKRSETPDETLRRYLADNFFKDHLRTYRKRPIYWLFSSGKQGAFQALVYLHRYHEGTLARLRTEYVLPLTSKMQARIDSLQADIQAASSTAARLKLTKQSDALKKQYLELLTYDEKLRHYADMRIRLDLDDGAKLNYGKFGDLLAEVKTVTGGTSDDD